MASRGVRCKFQRFVGICNSVEGFILVLSRLQHAQGQFFVQRMNMDGAETVSNPLCRLSCLQVITRSTRADTLYFSAQEPMLENAAHDRRTVMGSRRNEERQVVDEQNDIGRIDQCFNGM